MATLTATSTGTGMETGTGIPTHIPTILTGQPATASCTDSSAMHYYQQVSTMRLNTCMSSTWIFVNIINLGSVIISHPLPLATTKQMQSLWMPDEIQSDHNTCIHFLWCHCSTLATRKNWQRPRMHFLSPSVQTPHTLCGLHHMHRRFVSKLLQFEHVRDCAVTYFGTFGNLLRHFSDMLDTGPWLLLEMWCERHQFFFPLFDPTCTAVCRSTSSCFLAPHRSNGCWTASHHYTVLTYTLFVSFTHTHIQNTFSQR